jgi:WD40 repeat protein
VAARVGAQPVSAHTETTLADGSTTDGRVFVWHKLTGTLVQEVEAHQVSCNAVAWNPANPCMFATGGDDGRVRVWVPTLSLN